MGLRKIIHALFFLLLLIGCDSMGTEPDDLGPGTGGIETTVQEDITNIENSIDALLASMAAFEGGPFSSAFKEFLDLNQGVIGDTDWIDTMLVRLDDIIVIDTVGNKFNFDFGATAGVYDWEPVETVWIQSADSSDLILNFPASIGSQTNNAKLLLTDYSDSPANFNGENIWLPDLIAMSLEKDGEVISSLGLDIDSFTGEQQLSIPTKLTLQLYMSPVTHLIQFTRVSNTEFEFSWLSVDEEGILMLGFEASLLLSHFDYANLYIEDVEDVSLTVRISQNLRIELSANIGELSTLSEPTESEINAALTAEVYYGIQKIGDLEFDMETNDFIIIYKDGSSESSSRYHQHFFDQMEIIFSDFFGSGGMVAKLSKLKMWK